MLTNLKFQEDTKETTVPHKYLAERRKKSYQARKKRSSIKEIKRIRRDNKYQLIKHSKKQIYRIILKNLKKDSEKISLSRAYIKALSRSHEEFLPTLEEFAEEKGKRYIRGNKKELYETLKVIEQDNRGRHLIQIKK